MAAYGRELEAEADAMGLRLIAETGYDPASMPTVWRQLIGELDASAAMRRRHRRPQSLLATHPAPESRMRDLNLSTEEVKVAGRDYESGRERWLAAIGPHRRLLLDDQVKLNDPGASLYIIENLAADGWDGLLRYYEGEAWRLRGRDGDRERSERSYALAITYSDAPAEAWRAHGYALLRAGRRDEARSALGRYLELAPDAADSAMVRYSLQQ
jgi:beta-barrel assembly-enhancing protease